MRLQTRTHLQDKEVRTYSVSEFSVEQREEGDGRTIVGHAAVFNQVDGPEWFREQIEPGAFAESIKDDDVRALLNHDPNILLGRNTAGTLRLSEDKVGLRMEIDVPHTTAGSDLIESIQRGDISQASFAFQAVDASWDTVDGEEIRTIKRAKLFDVSPVTYPFYEATDITVRKVAWDRKREETENRKPKSVGFRRKELRLSGH